MLEALAFASLGLLVGTLVGLSGSVAFQGILALLLSALGGGAAYYVKDATRAERARSARLLLSLCLAAATGTLAGLAVSEHRLLSPRDPLDAAVTTALLETLAGERGDDLSIDPAVVAELMRTRSTLRTSYLELLRSGRASSAATIDDLYRQGDISCEVAYRDLKGLWEEAGSRATAKP